MNSGDFGRASSWTLAPSLRLVLQAGRISGGDRPGRHYVSDYHIGPANLAAMRAALDRLLADHPHLGSGVIICPYLLDERVQALKGAREWSDCACDPNRFEESEARYLALKGRAGLAARRLPGPRLEALLPA